MKENGIEGAGYEREGCERWERRGERWERRKVGEKKVWEIKTNSE